MGTAVGVAIRVAEKVKVPLPPSNPTPCVVSDQIAAVASKPLNVTRPEPEMTSWSRVRPGVPGVKTNDDGGFRVKVELIAPSVAV